MNSHLELVTGPDWDLDPLTLAIVRDDHLRVTNAVENDLITRLLKVSDRHAERVTRRAHLTQQWIFVLDRFPSGSDPLYLPKPPLQSIEAFTYLDADGVEQNWNTSPLPYDLSRPVGPEAGCARIKPVYGTVWPVTRACTMDAVSITFTAGYPSVGSPAEPCDVPEDILHGRLLLIGELYKQRSESMPSSLSPAIVRARELWMNYRVYRGDDVA